jgi:hypothetical protein
MKITIESTSKLVELLPSVGREPVLCRVWEGQTESGIRMTALIPRVMVLAAEDNSEFDRELQKTRAPSAESMAIPLRMIL